MSSSISSAFFLFLIFTTFAYSTSSLNKNIHTCPKKQSEALLLFKLNLSSINYPNDDCSGISDYHPIMMNWNTSTDCCKWDGVRCDNSTGDVIRLDLYCGMLQDIFAWGIGKTCPLLVVKSRQAMGLDKKHQYEGKCDYEICKRYLPPTKIAYSHKSCFPSWTLDEILKMIRYKGLHCFYKGISTNIEQSVLAAAFLFMVKEELVNGVRWMLLKDAAKVVKSKSP